MHKSIAPLEEISAVICFSDLDRLWLLEKPQKIFSTTNPKRIKPLLNQIEQAAKVGSWLVGFLRYEASDAFDLPVKHTEVHHAPLIWFAQFKKITPFLWPGSSFVHKKNKKNKKNRKKALKRPQGFETYRSHIKRIQDYIQAGDTYQVNYTLTADLDGDEDLTEIFLRLAPVHRHPYTLWLNTGSEKIASFSPELFLQKRGSKLTTAPIKGTRPRHQKQDKDYELGLQLKRSEKDLAEHVMIVDMARNDLGKVAKVGSVAVEKLCNLRKFPTLYHLETRVSGQIQSETSLAETFAALFP
ncbi:chorismate-binding protein, partial [Magnetococcales bacterium HHB-1]